MAIIWYNELQCNTLSKADIKIVKILLELKEKLVSLNKEFYFLNRISKNDIKLIDKKFVYFLNEYEILKNRIELLEYELIKYHIDLKKNLFLSYFYNKFERNLEKFVLNYYRFLESYSHLKRDIEETGIIRKFEKVQRRKIYQIKRKEKKEIVATHYPLKRIRIKRKRPVAVMIGNNRKARPQSGLYAADIVYEILAEGGDTRFMAIYFKDPGCVIGPVRSCRDYYLDYSREYDAIYAHCGASPYGFAALQKYHIDNLNEIKIGKGFYRDKSRKPPHNLYTKYIKLLNAAKELNYPLYTYKPWQIKYQEYPVPSGDIIFIEIPYSSISKAGYKYDTGSGKYIRYTNG